MKFFLLLTLTLIGLVGISQEYKGATPYWERQGNKIEEPGTSGNYLQKGGGLLVAGDLFMLGSAATAIIGTINYNNALDPSNIDEDFDQSEELKKYNTTLTVSGVAFGIGFLMRIIGHSKLKTSGELMQINDKTSLNLSGEGVMLSYKF